MSNIVRSVAYLCPGWPPERTPSGIATYVKNISDGLAVHGVSTRVLSIAPVAEDVSRQGVADLAEVDRKQRTLANRVADRILDQFGGDGAARRVGRAASCVLSASPEAQLVETEESFGFARWIRVPAVPCVVRLHGPWFINGPMYGLPEPRAFERRCTSEFLGIESAAGLTAPSRTVMEQTLAKLRKPPALTAVIPNPVAVSTSDGRWRPESSVAGRILYVGRFERIKGADILLQAFSQVHQKLPDAELVFVGPDNGFRDDAGRVWSIDEYMQENLPAGARARVKFLGAQPRAVIEKLRLECGVAVVSSRQETFPLALLESLAAGTPTIASQVGGMTEVLEEGKNGLLFRSGDSSHLAARILELVGSPRLSAALSSAGMASSRRFNPAEVAKQTLEYYDEVARYWARAETRR